MKIKAITFLRHGEYKKSGELSDKGLVETPFFDNFSALKSIFKEISKTNSKITI